MVTLLTRSETGLHGGSSQAPALTVHCHMFTRVTMTKCNGLAAPEAARPSPRCRRAGVWGGLSSWLADGTFSLCPHVVFALCVQGGRRGEFCVSSLLVRAPALLHQGPPLGPHWILISSLKVQTQSHWGLGVQYVNWGGGRRMTQFSPYHLFPKA